MKVTRDTPQHLIVGENPVWVGLLTGGLAFIFTAISLTLVLSGELFGLFFLVGTCVGLLTMFLFVRRVQLIFDRDAGTLTIQRKNLRRASQVEHLLSEVDRAELEGNGNMLRVVLIMTGQSAGRHPLTQAYSNVGDHHNVAGAINRWLRNMRRAEKEA